MGEHDARRRAAWRFVRAVIRSQSSGVIGAVASGLLWQTGAVAAPLMVKYAIDHGVLTRDRHTLVLWLVALLSVGLLEMAAGAVRHLYAIRNRSHADARVRDAIFAHALRLDPSYHDRVGPGELMSRASSDSEHVARMMDSIGHTIGYVLTVFAVSVVLLVIDWGLALIVLIPLPLVSVAGWAYSRRYHERTERLQESWAAAATLVEETVAGIRVVKGLGAGAPLSAEFRRRSDNIVQRALDIARLDAVFMPLLEFFPMLGLLAVLWLGGRRVIDGELSLGSFVAFNAYVTMLVWPLRVLGQRVTTLQKAVGASARISEVLDAEPQLREPRHPVRLTEGIRGDVRLENVQFGHVGDHPVLDGLDLRVPAGESLALVGGTEFIGALPDGYETVLGERGFSLSGGQRQRIAIARAILADPAVLVLDDATSAVDATKEHEIRAALTTVMEGRTTVVIAHRPATIALADRVAVLENGRVVEEGTHQELLRRSPRYRALLALEEAAA